MPTAKRDNYDTPWKCALTRCFPEFIAFYFPLQWAEIDWSKPPRFLDKELAQINLGDRPGSLIADKLVSVYLLDGSEEWVLINVEVQVQRDDDLARRIFAYNYRIFEHYRRPVASLVVLADDVPGWRPNEFRYALLGTEMGLRFATAKIADYATPAGELLSNENPFALITAAHLQTQQTHGLPEQRYVAKWKLTRLLYYRGWDKRRIIDLFKVINWLMKLPDELDRQLWQDIRKLERRHKMEWISPLEQSFIDKGVKRGLRQGLAKGLEQGLEQGRQEGTRIGAARILEGQLTARFGPLPKTARKRLESATVEQLGHWSRTVLQAPTLKQVFDEEP
jgi:hypothetical protein